jgi:hypothetical protein
LVVRELVALLGVKTDKKSFQSAGDTLKKVGTGLKKVAIAAGVVGAAVGAAGFKLIGLASDAKETLNVIDASFKENQKTVLDWAGSFAKEAGRSEFYLREMAGTFGAVLNPMMEENTDLTSQMSTRFAELAVDIGSFYNAAEPDVLLALRSALTGEAEPMKRFGVVITEDTLKAFALSQGIEKNVKDMSIAEKTTLRYNFILAQTKAAHGDAAKTATGWANASKRLKAKVMDIATTVGMAFLPQAEKMLNAMIEWIEKSGGVEGISERVTKVINQLVDGVKGVVEWFDKMLPPIPSLSEFKDTAKGVLDTLDAMIPIVAGLVASWAAYKAMVIAVMALDFIKNVLLAKKVVEGATFAQWLWNAAMTANPLGLIVVGIGLVVAAIVFLIRNWEAVKEIAIGTWTDISEFIIGVWDKVTSALSAGFGNLIQGFKNILGPEVLGFFSTLADGIASIWSTLVGWFEKFIIHPWANMFNVVKEALSGVWNFFKDKWEKMKGPLKALGKFVTGQTTIGETAAGQRAAMGPETVTAGATGAGGVNQQTKVDVHVNAGPGMDERGLAEESARRFDSVMTKQNRAAMRALVPQRS